MKIDFSNLQYQCRLLKKEIDKNIQAVLNKNFRSSLAGNILYTYFNGTVALLLAYTLKKSKVKADCTSVLAQYTVQLQNRNKLKAHLDEQGKPTAAHYPMPLYLQQCFRFLKNQQGSFPIATQVAKSVLSLPMNPFLAEEGVHDLAKILKSPQLNV